jgi:hypothetical protein
MLQAQHLEKVATDLPTYFAQAQMKLVQVAGVEEDFNQMPSQEREERAEAVLEGNLQARQP